MACKESRKSKNSKGSREGMQSKESKYVKESRERMESKDGKESKGHIKCKESRDGNENRERKTKERKERLPRITIEKESELFRKEQN